MCVCVYISTQSPLNQYLGYMLREVHPCHFGFCTGHLATLINFIPLGRRLNVLSMVLITILLLLMAKPGKGGENLTYDHCLRFCENGGQGSRPQRLVPSLNSFFGHGHVTLKSFRISLGSVLPAQAVNIYLSASPEMGLMEGISCLRI